MSDKTEYYRSWELTADDITSDDEENNVPSTKDQSEIENENNKEAPATLGERWAAAVAEARKTDRTLEEKGTPSEAEVKECVPSTVSVEEEAPEQWVCEENSEVAPNSVTTEVITEVVEGFDDSNGDERLCGVCYEVFTPFDWPKGAHPPHEDSTYCSSCVGNYIASQIHDRSGTVRCVCREIDEPLDQNQMSYFLTAVGKDDLISWHDRNNLMRFLETDPNTKFCPRGCLYAVSDCVRGKCGNRTVNCPCGYDWCFTCGLAAHTGRERCLGRPYRSLADRMSMQWVSRHTQKCPGCKTVFEKNEGCNSMDCSVCHTNFCFSCGRRPGSGHWNILNVMGCPGMQTTQPSKVALAAARTRAVAIVGLAPPVIALGITVAPPILLYRFTKIKLRDRRNRKRWNARRGRWGKNDPRWRDGLSDIEMEIDGRFGTESSSDDDDDEVFEHFVQNAKRNPDAIRNPEDIEAEEQDEAEKAKSDDDVESINRLVHGASSSTAPSGIPIPPSDC